MSETTNTLKKLSWRGNNPTHMESLLTSATVCHYHWPSLSIIQSWTPAQTLSTQRAQSAFCITHATYHSINQHPRSSRVLRFEPRIWLRLLSLFSLQYQVFCRTTYQLYRFYRLHTCDMEYRIYDGAHRGPLFTHNIFILFSGAEKSCRKIC